jgi:hypothetical protein
MSSIGVEIWPTAIGYDLQQWSVNLGCLLPKIFLSVVGY